MRVVEEGEDAVILFLLEGIVLVVVALGALDGDAEDTFADGVHAVEHGLHAELLGVDAALFVDHRIAQEPGGDALVLGGVRQQVAGDLLDDELVVGQVVIEGVDDPVAVEPDDARGVLFVAVGIGVARGVQPDARPAFAVMGRGEQAVYLLLVGVRGLVGEEGIEFLGRGRKAGEVEAQAAQQGGAIGFGRGLQSFAFQPGEYEGVDRVWPGRGTAGRTGGMNAQCFFGAAAIPSGHAAPSSIHFRMRSIFSGGERRAAHRHPR